MLIANSSHMAFPPQRLSVDEYHQLIQRGIITEDDKVELLEGLLVAKSRRTPAHELTLELVNELFLLHVPEGWRMRWQSAITMIDSEPEPDLAIVCGHPRSRRGRHPGPQDLALVVEVAEFSLAHDRTIKARVDARAGIACYWIINLIDDQIEVYTEPTGPDPASSYSQRQDYHDGDEIPLVIEGEEVARLLVADFWS